MFKQIIKIMKKLFYLTLIIALASCKKKDETSCDGSTPTYDTEINVIINQSCATSNCHTTDYKHGDFTSYENMKEVLDNGKFATKVLDNKSMPKGSSLDESELNLIRCWVDNGYPEN